MFKILFLYIQYEYTLCTYARAKKMYIHLVYLGKFKNKIMETQLGTLGEYTKGYSKETKNLNEAGIQLTRDCS